MREEEKAGASHCFFSEIQYWTWSAWGVEEDGPVLSVTYWPCLHKKRSLKKWEGISQATMPHLEKGLHPACLLFHRTHLRYSARTWYPHQLPKASGEGLLQTCCGHCSLSIFYKDSRSFKVMSASFLPHKTNPFSTSSSKQRQLCCNTFFFSSIKHCKERNIIADFGV